MPQRSEWPNACLRNGVCVPAEWHRAEIEEAVEPSTDPEGMEEAQWSDHAPCPARGVGTVPSVQLFSDYLIRLIKYIEFMKRVVPMHDDLFDFFYEALPGYEKVGERRVLLACWGGFQDPDRCTFDYRTMSDWGTA